MNGGRQRVVPGRTGFRPLTRREVLRFGIAGGTLACMGRACQTGPKTPEPPKPPPDDKPVYRLAPGDSLYDDFDGHGNFQTYDGRDLATAGALCERIWFHDDGPRVVDAASLSPPPPLAADGGRTGLGPALAPAPNRVLEINCVGQMSAYAWLYNPQAITFADFGSLRADVRLSSRSTAPDPGAALNFHTTIPEQPPGRSWFVSLGLYKDLGGAGALVMGQYGNFNLGIMQTDVLGAAALDEWRALRLDIVTKADDPRLGDSDLRLDYYLDGELKASRIPEDSAILIDPSRTGLGPHRSLFVSGNGYEGNAVGHFDNVRAVYRDRIA